MQLWRQNFIDTQSLSRKRETAGGFTLIELLVVLGIVSLLMAIMVPALGKVRRHAKMLVGTSNLRQILICVNVYALDNDEKYPESVATVGFGSRWHWKEPTMLTSHMMRSQGLHRSMSAYLRSYIEDASIMFCPNAPSRYKYFQEAWDAGDDWDNPETGPVPDPVHGTYCFYWNYAGWLGEGRIFTGPSSFVGRPNQSKLLVSDYFGYDHWRSPNAWGSCEIIKGAGVTAETWVSSAYWSRPISDGDMSLGAIGVKLKAGYSDGRVERYSPSEAVPMKVSITPDGSIPYPDWVGFGDFYLPRNGLH